MGKTVDTLLVAANTDEKVKQFGISWGKQVLQCGGSCTRFVNTFDELVATLHEYDTIKHLVISTHMSITGGICLKLTDPKTGKLIFDCLRLSKIIPMFQNTFPQVTEQVDMEGCVAAAGAEELWDFGVHLQARKVTAYNHWHVIETASLTNTKGKSAADVEKTIKDKYDDYLLPGTDFGEIIKGSKASQVVIVEWFRDEPDEKGLESREHGQREKIFKHRKDAVPKLITDRQQAADYGPAFAHDPVHIFELVTLQLK